MEEIMYPLAHTIMCLKKNFEESLFLYVQLFPSILAISKLHCLYLMGTGFESCLAMVGNLNWKCQVFPMEHNGTCYILKMESPYFNRVFVRAQTPQGQSCLLNITGANDRRADTTTIVMDLNDITSPVVVKTYSSTPALIKPKDVPTKNGKRGTPITGEEMLMNQLGRKGVMRKNIMVPVFALRRPLQHEVPQTQKIMAGIGSE
ncbi:hypothetical protein pdam_00011760, partial [Pocillopora damicornis]